MIIDFHTHVFPNQIASRTLEVLKGNAYNSRGVNAVSYTEGTVDSLKASMEDNNISLSVVLPIATKPKQTTSINDFAEEITQGNIISFGSLHPLQEDWETILEDLAKRGFKGIKLHPQYQDVYIDSPEVIRVLKKAEELGLYSVFHAGRDIGFPPDTDLCTPQRIKRLLDYVSGEYLVAAHLGSFELWDDVEKYLVGTKISFDVSYTYGFVSKEQFTRIIKNHGADKILYGSDSPWGSQSAPLKVIETLDLTKDEIDFILFKNANRILNL